MQNLLNELKAVLAQDGRFTVEGKLLKNKVIEAGLQVDPALVKLLLQNTHIKSHFFQEVEGALVFDKVKFQQFISNKEFLPDSYTAFKNKIGLTANGEFLAETKEVILSWAYKDCILEGGQDKENAKRDEVFWNEVLAPGDIDRLLHPKVLTNWKRYTKDGEQKLKTLSLQDSLILKGNNLLALHSLKKVFRGKIKLIYIDPPYNTESDSFRYNDNFSNSTWLTFIKNRIAVAKELLSNDGFLFVHISFHQFAYLKVLLDEMFLGNHVCTFNLLVRHPNRILKGDKDFHDVMEYLLVYTKDKVKNKIAKRLESKDIDQYIYNLKELGTGKFVDINGKQIEYFEPGEILVTKNHPSSDNFQKISIRGSLKEGNSSGRFYEKHLAHLKDNFKPFTIFKVPGIGGDKYDFRFFYLPEEGKQNGGYFQGVPMDSKDYKEKPYPNFIDLVKEFNNVGYEGDVDFRNGKKPELLIQKVFELGKVTKGDIVMDFFLGSGTTAAVAHKMGINYIGIEQIDYGENGAVNRLISVISGEGGGISSETGWSGGGAFVYAELKQANQAWIDEIAAANSSEALNDLWHKMQQHAFISYKVEPKAISETASDFASLDFEEKQHFLIEVLDKNALYVNLSDIENQDFQVSEEDKTLTKFFYSLK